MSIEKLSKAASDILAERDRQKTAKGWTEEHDDAHDNGELNSRHLGGYQASK